MSTYPLNPTPNRVRNLEAYIVHAEEAATKAQAAAQGISDQVAIATTQAQNASKSAQDAATTAGGLASSVAGQVATAVAGIKAVRVDVNQGFLADEARTARNNVRTLGYAVIYLNAQTQALTVDDAGKAIFSEGVSTITLPADNVAQQGDEFELYVAAGTLTVNNNASSTKSIFLDGATQVASIVLVPGPYRIRCTRGSWVFMGKSAPADRFPSVGDVVLNLGRNAPPGTLKMNGSLVSRTTYADLWAYAQAQNVVALDGDWLNNAFSGMFSSGDGSKTFRLPDFRGEFPRFWDDGRGQDNGRVMGLVQGSALPNHYHETSTGPSGSNQLQWTNDWPYGGRSVNQTVVRSRVGTVNETSANTYIQNTSGPLGYSGEDVRPRNIPILACIRYK